MRTKEQELQDRLNIDLTQNDIDAYEHYCSVASPRVSVDEYLKDSDLICEFCGLPADGLYRDNDTDNLFRYCKDCVRDLEETQSADLSLIK
jgi:hypothetical protein